MSEAEVIVLSHDRALWTWLFAATTERIPERREHRAVNTENDERGTSALRARKTGGGSRAPPAAKRDI